MNGKMELPRLLTIAVWTLFLTPSVYSQQQDNSTQSFKIVCYFPNYVFFRKGRETFTPEDINPRLCTHVNYAFAVLDPKSLVLTPEIRHVDVDNQFYKRIVALKIKNPKLKVLLAVGGWSDSGQDKYSRLVHSPPARQTFIRHAVTMLRQYRFDGLDLDWEFPVCWQGNCTSGPQTDKRNFMKFVEEIKAVFEQQSPRLLLTVAISANKEIIDKAYNIQKLARTSDFLNVMAYDYHGPWEDNVAHHAPLFPQNDAEKELNVRFTLNYLKRKGAPPRKLVVGIPSYGRNYTLIFPDQHDYNAPAALDVRPFQPTIVPYYENNNTPFPPFMQMCRRVKTGTWTKRREKRAGPYAFKGTQWIGYDDPIAAQRKARFIRRNGFGGAMLWEITSDDYNPFCCQTKFPILKAINRGLYDKGPTIKSFGCE